jgi:hypothetical protein
MRLLFLFLLGCNSSTAIHPNSDGGAEPTTCAEVAAELCARAATCVTTGQAPVWISSGTRVLYESAAYCTMIFTNQCGPQAPASDVPLVRDPVACGAALSGAFCQRAGLLLPVACGYQ